MCGLSYIYGGKWVRYSRRSCCWCVRLKLAALVDIIVYSNGLQAYRV